MVLDLMSSSAVEILVVGAGAVGAFYGSRLAQAPNVKVSVVCRSNYDTVKTSGFKVSSPTYGEYTFAPARTYGDKREARSSQIRWDYVVVATKALPDVSDDSVLLEGLIQPQTRIVLIQNGLGIEAPYIHRFPETTVLSAVTTVSTAQTEPGIIKHNRWTRISVGPYFGGRENESKRKEIVARNIHFVTLLEQGGIKDAEPYDYGGLQLLRWHKVAINAAMNPTSVLSGGTSYPTMTQDPELSRHILATMQEVFDAAAKILGRPLPKSFASPSLILRSAQRNTEGSVPSMQFDWQRGKVMELEVILGNPMRIARDHGIDMPRLQTLYALLKMAQENRRQAEAMQKSGNKL